MKAQSLEVAPSELRPNPWNTNIVTPEMERRIAGSLDRFGMFKPVIVRQVSGVKGFEILAGEHRWSILKARGEKSVPIWNLGEIDDRIAKEISIADNARYGADDTLALSELLKELGTEEDIQTFLPYGDAELHEIFSSSDIALADLDLDQPDETPVAETETPIAKAPKTHTMIRFKVPNEDAERIARLITQTQKDNGFTSEDQATNAGDALVHILFSSGSFDIEDEA